MIKHAPTTGERHPLDVIKASGGVIQRNGSLDWSDDPRKAYDWARYTNKGGADALAIWREIQIPPDGVDYDLLCVTTDEINAGMWRSGAFGEWQRNLADVHAIDTAYQHSMTDAESNVYGVNAEHKADDLAHALGTQ